MYTEDDLQSAVKAGVIEPSAAEALRGFVANNKSSPATSEENFRLVTGFNDIFVTIAVIIMLFAMWWIGNSFQVDVHNYSGTNDPDDTLDYGRHKALGGFFCAATAWVLAEYFVRIRRMALPSIVLLLALVIGVFFGANFYFWDQDYTQFGYVYKFDDGPNFKAQLAAQTIRENGSYALAALLTSIVATLFWFRMRAPIAISAATAMATLTILFGVFYFTGTTALLAIMPLILMLCCGIAIFGFAMWWDVSDTSRTTQRSDIAFWLHMLAAPLIAHALFGLIGINEGDDISTAAVILVLALYTLFATIAIIVDRRALLVSALAYVLIAMTALFRNFGVIELGVAFTAFIIGSALLLLSAFWPVIRRNIVKLLPVRISSRLPKAA
jgi:hypothetical protein